MGCKGAPTSALESAGRSSEDDASADTNTLPRCDSSVPESRAASAAGRAVTAADASGSGPSPCSFARADLPSGSTGGCASSQWPPSCARPKRCVARGCGADVAGGNMTRPSSSSSSAVATAAAVNLAAVRRGASDAVAADGCLDDSSVAGRPAYAAAVTAERRDTRPSLESPSALPGAPSSSPPSRSSSSRPPSFSSASASSSAAATSHVAIGWLGGGDRACGGLGLADPLPRRRERITCSGGGPLPKRGAGAGGGENLEWPLAVG